MNKTEIDNLNTSQRYTGRRHQRRRHLQNLGWGLRAYWGRRTESNMEKKWKKERKKQGADP